MFDFVARVLFWPN